MKALLPLLRCRVLPHFHAIQTSDANQNGFQITTTAFMIPAKHSDALPNEIPQLMSSK
jgi:hypothetical protein